MAYSRGYAPNYSVSKKSSNNIRVRRNNKTFFHDLHDKQFLSSLGQKVEKPQIPKILYPKSRVSVRSISRPNTSIMRPQIQRYS